MSLRLHSRIAGGWAVLAAACLLCLAAVWNGQPLLYPDTPTYLRGAEMGAGKALGGRVAPWLPAEPAPAADAPASTPQAADAARPKGLTSVEDKVVLAGRSVYYGALLYASHLAGSLWLTVALQALCVAYLLQLLMVRLWGLGTRHLLGTVAALGLLTPLAAYTGFLMPDIFAGLGILAMATLAAYWQRLGRADRIALSLLLLFGLCAHASHVVIAAALLGVGLLARLSTRRWKHLPGAAFAVAGACIVAAVAAEWVFNQAVTRAVGAPPLRMPHPMARLVDMGPGTDYLRRNCPRAGYEACAFLANYPTAWDDFLFSTDPNKGAFALADAAGKRRMAAEQLRFVADVVRHDPAGVAAGVAADVLRQLALFRVDIWGYGPRELAMYEGRVPPSLYAGMRASRGAYNPRYNQWLSAATYLSTAAAVLALLWWWRRASSAGALSPAAEPRRFADFLWITLAGIALNALVCASLASSADRFQARVIWLLPFLALSALALAYARRPTETTAAASPPPSLNPSSTTSLQGSAS
ncbi:hypothetical protein [Ramlibacter tataouinensis]|uniref:Candidate membrane protein n=1 Tax=Ramlibacter tataouinensis (strain ATCC BAA-407 / DSM 14655 / LMG 21543 / TTB310) TaxID=365046 RepID=F5Y346_RAMTT|nr:hypothetical protein [Ramlibacter tataouinensis]AEG94926.1 candidate membrane protein [Ramlibacter tataouinensis TTB310]